MGVPTMRLLQSLLVLAAVATFVAADTNVFGERLAPCGSHKSCAYHAADKAAHEVCVRKLPHGFSAATGQGHWSDRFNCNAIPAKVLDEKYSLDKFAQCGKMSSRGGCGPEDIRRSIDKICSQCSSEARNSKARSTLRAKCNRIKNAAKKAVTAQELVQELPASADEEVPEEWSQ